MVQRIVARWADYASLGDLSPHDLRRTAITRSLHSGLTYRQVQMMSKHRDPKTVMRYDRGRENLEQNAVNLLGYEEELLSMGLADSRGLALTARAGVNSRPLPTLVRRLPYLAVYAQTP